MSQLSLLLFLSNQQRLYFLSPFSPSPSYLFTIVSVFSRVFLNVLLVIIVYSNRVDMVQFCSLVRGTFLFINKPGKSCVASHQSIVLLILPAQL